MTAERGKTVKVNCCFNTPGKCQVPPIFIYPIVEMTDTLTTNGPPKFIYSCFKSGCNNVDLFQDWFEKFQNQRKTLKNDPVLLILSNHSSHNSLSKFKQVLLRMWIFSFIIKVANSANSNLFLISRTRKT